MGQDIFESLLRRRRGCGPRQRPGPTLLRASERYGQRSGNLAGAGNGRLFFPHAALVDASLEEPGRSGTAWKTSHIFVSVTGGVEHVKRADPRPGPFPDRWREDPGPDHAWAVA